MGINIAMKSVGRILHLAPSCEECRWGQWSLSRNISLISES